MNEVAFPSLHAHIRGGRSPCGPSVHSSCFFGDLSVSSFACLVVRPLILSVFYAAVEQYFQLKKKLGNLRWTLVRTTTKRSVAEAKPMRPPSHAPAWRYACEILCQNLPRSESRWAPPRPPRSRGFCRGRCFSEYLFTEICLRILILLNTFFCVFLETFSSGGVPPDAPGDAKVSLGGASGDQVCFFIDF